MTRRSAHSRLLNEKVSYGQHDPNFMKENKANTGLSRKGQGRSQPQSQYVSSGWGRLRTGPLTPSVGNAAGQQRSGDCAVSFSGPLSSGPMETLGPRTATESVSAAPSLMLQRKTQQSSFCSLLVLLQDKGWALCAVSP